mmetsp:Transcript_96271/g.170221  ORF Transcript_96271/g.170221 Transcript_96271/m.170221 type:complete len:321 (+) Transcript_96271:71-1033(+)
MWCGCNDACDASEWRSDFDGKAPTDPRKGASSRMERRASQQQPEFGRDDIDVEIEDQGYDFDRRMSLGSVESIDPRAPPQVKMEQKAEDTDEINCCICTGHRVDEATVLQQAWWCFYCCCGGLACYNAHAPCRLDTMCCGCLQTCEFVEIETREGVCSFIQSCCCCSQIMQIPPPEGIPIGICCNLHCCGARGNSKEKEAEIDRHSVASDPYTLFDHHIFEMMVPCFLFCMGYTCRQSLGTCYEGYCKCGFFRCSGKTIPLTDEGGCTCCSCLLNCGNFFTQGRLPCRFAGNPIIACAGWKCKRTAHIPSFGAPRQQEMH